MPTGELAIAALFADRYLVERRLGQGGMGTVYLARDQKHDRLVALKVLRPELAALVGPERFLREIRIAAHLAHPHILPLHDSGTTDGLLWYVMPYVDGESLRERIRRERQLSIEEALRLTCQVAGALDYAHRRNVVHRDVKPENILLQDNNAVVADFGIARAIGSAEETQLTGTGLVLGSPAYMSPEQAAGDAAVDGRSDLYSLGCLLYELLAGEPPFTGPTAAAVAAKRLSCPVPRVRVLRPLAPQGVEQALSRALALVPADRFRNAGEFRAALAACGAGSGESPVVASVADAAVPTTPSRSRLRAAAGVAVLGALAAGGLVLRLGGPGPGPAHAAPIKTLAVLPIAETSGGADHPYLAEGLTDALIGELMRIPELRVISRTSVMRYAGAGGDEMSGPGMTGGMSFMAPGAMASAATPSGDSAASGMAAMGSMASPKSLAQIARELRADVVVQASFIRQADSIRISAALVDPSTRNRFWARSYVRHLRDLFGLQQEVAAEIASAVRGGSGDRGPAALPGPGPVNPAAHEAYLKAVYYQVHWRLPEAIAAFGKAVELDAGFAPAYAGMARAYYFSAFFGDMAPGVALGRMQYAAGMALERDSLLAEAHGQMALVKMLHEWNWAAAERSFRRALELAPGNAQIHHDYAHFLLALGRRRESLEQTEQAVGLDPANPMLLSCMGWHSLFDHEYERAIKYASEANQLMPDFWAQIVRGWALLGQGKPDSAILALREATRLTPSAFASAALGHGVAVTGHTAEARRVLRGLLARHEREYVSAYDIASIYAALGEADEAFKWLRRAADERSTFLVHLGWDMRFEKLRGDPRYRELLVDRLALPEPARVVAWADVRGRGNR